MLVILWYATTGDLVLKVSLHYLLIPFPFLSVPCMSIQ